MRGGQLERDAFGRAVEQVFDGERQVRLEILAARREGFLRVAAEVLSGIGLVLSVPLTTGVAALTVGSAVAAASASATPRRAKPAHDHDHG